MPHVLRQGKGGIQTTSLGGAFMMPMRLLCTLAIAVLPRSFSWVYRSKLVMATVPQVRFITNTKCPYAQRTWIALEESGTRYKMEEIALYGSGGKPRWFMELNPKGEVPVLVVDDNSVIGSEETVDHLMQGALNSHEYRDISSQWRTKINERLRPAGKQAVLSGGSGTARANLANALKDLDACLAKDSREGKHEVNGSGPFVCGATFTAADVSAFPFLQRVKEEFGFPESCTRLEEWYTSASRRPAVRKTINKNWWWWW